MDFGIFLTLWNFLTNKYVLTFLLALLITSIIPTYKKLLSFLNSQENDYRDRLNNLIKDDIEVKKKIFEIYSKVESIYEELVVNKNLHKDRHINLLNKLQECHNELKNVAYVLESNFKDLHMLSKDCKNEIIDNIDLDAHDEKINKLMIDNAKICEILDNLKSSIAKLDNLITLALNKQPIFVNRYDDSDLLKSIHTNKNKGNKNADDGM